jgi:hypothetical protein
VTTIQLVDLEKLGTVLKDAAEAIKKLVEAIAYSIQTGDDAWKEVSARRTRTRLIEVYKFSQTLSSETRSGEISGYCFPVQSQTISHYRRCRDR